MSNNHPYYQFPLYNTFYDQYSSQFYYFPNYQMSQQLIQAQYFQKDYFLNNLKELQRQVQTQENQRFNSLHQKQEQIQLDKEESDLKNKKRKRKDGNYFNKYQKEDRNLNSIVLRNFVNFIHLHPRIQEIVKSIIQTKQLQIGVNTYLQLFRSYLPSKQAYVGVGKIKSFIDLQRQKKGIKYITLVLLRKFIDLDFFSVLVYSKKVSRLAREKEMKHGRKFWNFLIKQCL